MTTPNTYTPAQVVKLASEVSCGLPDGRWVAARPMGWPGLCLRKRLRAAWLVFTGQADVLQWEGGQ